MFEEQALDNADARETDFSPCKGRRNRIKMKIYPSLFAPYYSPRTFKILQFRSLLVAGIITAWKSIRFNVVRLKNFLSHPTFPGRKSTYEGIFLPPPSVSRSIRLRNVREHGVVRCKHGVVLAPSKATRRNVETICACLLANIEISSLSYIFNMERRREDRTRVLFGIRCR